MVLPAKRRVSWLRTASPQSAGRQLSRAVRALGECEPLPSLPALAKAAFRVSVSLPSSIDACGIGRARAAGLFRGSLSAMEIPLIWAARVDAGPQLGHRRGGGARSWRDLTRRGSAGRALAASSSSPSRWLWPSAISGGACSSHCRRFHGPSNPWSPSSSSRSRHGHAGRHAVDGAAHEDAGPAHTRPMRHKAGTIARRRRRWLTC